MLGEMADFGALLSQGLALAALASLRKFERLETLMSPPSAHPCTTFILERRQRQGTAERIWRWRWLADDVCLVARRSDVQLTRGSDQEIMHPNLVARRSSKRETLSLTSEERECS